ncbi:MAG: exodeoxyribonuclease V subunit gamma, partial [Psychrobacter sp.]|nr:exodeoxyribonuclease V subunit gamma [Psychrobacter sp.]
MFTIIQSHRTERLVAELLRAYQSKDQPIFEEFVVIVPSMVLGDWLDKMIASQAGISTLVTTKFWGQYQWALMQEVLSAHNAWLSEQSPNAPLLNVPEVAVLSTTVMQWRLFGYLTLYRQTIMEDAAHPLHPLLESLLGTDSDQVQQETRLWQLSTDLARVFNRYLTHRDNWLNQWSNNTSLDVEAMIKEKDALSERFDQFATDTPPWLTEHYIELEAAQRHLWYHLFAGVHQHRVAIEQLFWQALEANPANERSKLPKNLRIFTIQQLPQNELDFLQHLSRYMNITLLHYNPSKLFWADIVDKVWLQRQKIINPDSVFLRDHGHALLSRLGKQSRETFAMLAGLSGNEFHEDIIIDWQDRFTEDDEHDSFSLSHSADSIDYNWGYDQTNDTLLSRLQHDVLMLDESGTQQAAAARVSQALGEQLQISFDDVDSASIEEMDNQQWHSDEMLQQKRFIKHREWQVSDQDNSLSIHACHSLQRQLEILRGMIGRWLNEPLTSEKSLPKRHLSDIVVLLPDVDRHHALINSVFVDGKGQDGLTLPAKVTGVVDTSIRQLWEAISGFYRLLGSENARFEAPEVLDWLMLPPLYESFGLTHEQMSRGCNLLIEAGFVRGFDERHLQQSLDTHDYDYRFSFAHALDKLTLGLIMPEAKVNASLYPLTWPEGSLPEKSLPLAGIGLGDAPLIEALCRIYQGLEARRDDHQQRLQAEDWLKQIESQVIHTYFAAVDQTRSMRAIYQAMNGFKSSLRANRHYQQYGSQTSANNEAANQDLSDQTADNQTTGNQATSKQPLDAHELEQRLSKVEKLPLKLSFMLDSIEDELESQQVSAEPTGVITFGRFGALRNVPFGLVVMLNMNISEFPNRDRDNRYDLMKAGLAQRGDRFSEDDDNGAFLDALLCARSACWIFYNGQSLNDTHEHLPANPVSELLQFLQGEVKWQWQPVNGLEEGADAATTEKVQRYLPNLVERWLVTHHPALPFSRDLFERDVGLLEDEVTDKTSFESHDGTSPKHNNSNKHGNGQDHTSSDNQENDSWRKPLDQAMQRVKYEQRLQYPPAEVWQSVFAELNKRDTHIEQGSNQDNETTTRLKLLVPSEERPNRQQTVTLPTLAQYKLMAKMLSSPLLSDKISQPKSTELSKKELRDFAELIGIESLSEVELSESLRQDIFAIEQIDIQSLVFQVRHPAKQFLREQQVFIAKGEEMLSRQEPLSLDGLTRYQIHDQLLKQLHIAKPTPNLNLADDFGPSANSALKDNDSLKGNSNAKAFDDIQALLYQDVMPAGVARHTTLSHQLALMQSQCEDFKAQLKAQHIDIDGSTSDSTEKTYDDNEPISQALGLLTPVQEVTVEVNLDEVFESLLAQSFTSANHESAVVPVGNAKSTDKSNTTAIALEVIKDWLPEQIKLKGAVPYVTKPSDDAKMSHCKVWLNILPNSARAEHLLRFWLSHLYWQVSR